MGYKVVLLRVVVIWLYSCGFRGYTVADWVIVYYGDVLKILAVRTNEGSSNQRGQYFCKF